MNIYLVFVQEGVSNFGISSSILKTFTFMDESMANRFVDKIKRIKEEFNETKNNSEKSDNEILKSLIKRYPRIPVNFHLIQNVEIKELAKINVNLDCLEYKVEDI